MAQTRPPQTKATDTYLEHFGLEDAPFSTSPNPSYAYANDSMVTALRRMRGVVTSRSGLGIVDGEVGQGKTTLARSFVSDLETRGVPVVSLLNVPGGARQSEAVLLRTVSAELKLPRVKGDSADGNFNNISDFAFARNEEGNTTVVVIDDAHELRRNGIRAVLRLLNLQTINDQLMNIILFGQAPELLDVLKSDRALHSRLAARVQLTPLVAGEIAAMIKHRLRIAGRTKPLFTDAAIEAIAEASRGIPRLICRIAHYACELAYEKKLQKVDHEEVAQASKLLASDPSA
jgi:general secretion pathway protein A